MKLVTRSILTLLRNKLSLTLRILVTTSPLVIVMVHEHNEPHTTHNSTIIGHCVYGIKITEPKSCVREVLGSIPKLDINNGNFCCRKSRDKDRRLNPEILEMCI